MFIKFTKSKRVSKSAILDDGEYIYFHLNQLSLNEDKSILIVKHLKI